MKKNMESFIFGEGKTPEWFNKEANAGRVKVMYDEDNQIIGCQIISGTKTYEAEIGDTILNTKYGLMVVSKDKAKQYGLQKKDDKKEIKEETTTEE
jgi:hypothetical protein